MKLEILKIEKSINKSYFKQSLKYKNVELFKENFSDLLKKIDTKESEEHNKNIISNFLRDTFYKNYYEINTSGRKDLVIHKGTTNKTPVAVIIETKKPNNKSEMLSWQKPNTKALHETIHYFLKERIYKNNTEIKHIIISNIYEWYIFDATEFEKYFYQNKQFLNKYIEWSNGHLLGNSTEWFYNELAKPYIDNNVKTLKCNYINLNKYSSIIKNTDKLENKKLINLYKIFSPEHLLKLPFANDYNKIDNKFYNELLYILGLQEIKINGKKLITRVKEKNRNPGTILEDTINILKVRNKIENIPRPDLYGQTEEEQLFSIALELSITWLNRILFLKLLEGQLVRYNTDNPKFEFINSKNIKYFAELDELFFEVLAIQHRNRTQSINIKFGNLPYLNSSLFERTELEKQTIQISDLKDRLNIPLFNSTVLKKDNILTNEKKTLKYLLDFLSAYNFSSETKAEIQNDNRTIINAAVLGLIFEKINGYKDGSFYTPNFITTYISQTTIKMVVVNKFKEKMYKNLEDFNELKHKIDYTNKKERQKANDIINSIKICDPAVGSGHFLVSVLNELIAVKSELKILQDTKKNRIRGIKIKNINDELEIINEETSEQFQYYVNKKGIPPSEIQNLQKALFYEKQNLIENCIFGVDINQKSVSICRLRLWIELLKNTFYTKESDYKFLETLPNIDINIKHGNSLISFFNFNGNSLQNGQLKKLYKFTKKYKTQVDLYKNIKDSKSKDKILENIKDIKEYFISFANPNDTEFAEHKKKKAKLTEQFIFFNKDEQEEWKIKHEKLKEEVSREGIRLEKKRKKVYKQAFEWRFEFPEILSEQGEFLGFDLVVGNPPYFSISKQQILKAIKHNYKTYRHTGDIYILFIERALQILKKDGILSYITSNKWIRAGYGENLRKFLLETTKIQQLIDFDGLKVFDEATVDTNIITLTKQNNQNNKINAVRLDKSFDLEKDCMIDYYNKNKIELSELGADSWNLISKNEKLLRKQIEKIGQPLKKWKIKIFRGLTTGLNEAFIIDTKIRNKLIKENKNNSKIIKPIIRGRDIKKYYANFNELWLLYIPWHFPLHKDTAIKGNSEIAEKEFIKKYPEIYKLLSKNKQKLSNRNIAETGIRYEWYALQRSAATYHNEFEKEKIIFTKASQQKSFAYDDKGYFLQNTSYLLTGENLKYLLALLNSKLIKFAFINFYQSGGIEGEITVKAIEKIPIPEITKQNNKTVAKIINITNEILVAKNQNTKIDITKKQAKIDKLVYKLYDLNSAEIQLVEKE